MDMNTSNLLDFSFPPAPVAPTATEAKKDDIIPKDDDHSQAKEENVFGKNSSSTDDFEHVDDFMLGSTKKPITENVKSATQDFLAFEQSGDFVAPPVKEIVKPSIPEPAVIEKVEEVKKDDKKIDDIFSSDIQSDYLNPYNDVMTKKPQEEKFISSEDLLNDFKDVVEEDKVDEEVKETRNILDTTVYDDTAPILAKAVEPEPVVKPPTPEPVKPPTPEPPVVAPVVQPEPVKPEPVKQEPVKPAPVKEEKLIEAEKMFKQFGLGKSIITYATPFDLTQFSFYHN